jgi:hypothetical protein
MLADVTRDGAGEFIQRIWKEHGLKPHQIVDIVGL